MNQMNKISFLLILTRALFYINLIS